MAKYRILRYTFGMTVKTSISLPEEIIAEINETGQSRSAFILEATREKLQRLKQKKRDEQEVAKLNNISQKIADELHDTLGDQQLP